MSTGVVIVESEEFTGVNVVKSVIFFFFFFEYLNEVISLLLYCKVSKLCALSLSSYKKPLISWAIFVARF